MFVILTFFAVAGTAALALSQFAIRSFIKLKDTTRWGFIVWLLVEFFIISIAIHSVNIYLLELSFFDAREYFITLKYTLMTLVLPYMVALLLLYLQKQGRVVEELHIQVRKTTSSEAITVLDENGKVAMNIPARNILYFKSEDNYVLLYYRGDGDAKRKELIRTNLKKLEQELDFPFFVRIHRSYMINTLNLNSVVKSPKGYLVKLEGTEDDLLPVSATYQISFEEKIINNQ
ncbi:MAG TPA: LytTR family DNA-binding domain-containing protein [Cyclobacteriaceae bacterium]